MPNPRLLKTATRITQRGNKLKNRLLSPFTAQRGDIKLYVLKRDGAIGNGKFKVLAILLNVGQDTEQTAFRNRTYFEVAESEPVFGTNGDKYFHEILGSASHVAPVPNGELYTIREGDAVQVIQTDFTYKIFAQITSQIFNPNTDV